MAKYIFHQTYEQYFEVEAETEEEAITIGINEDSALGGDWCQWAEPIEDYED